MRILVAHNFYQVPGGEDTVVRSEIDLLRRNGHEVIVYERHNDELTQLNPVAKIQRLLALGNNPQTYQQLRDLIRRDRPAIAHFHNIYYMMTPAAYRACQSEGVPVIQTLHNFRMMCSNGLFYRHGHVCEDCLTKGVWEGVKHRCFRDSALLTALMAHTLSRLSAQGVWTNAVDRYIAAAEFTRRKYVDFGIPLERISYKPHFMFPDLGRRKSDEGYALYLGRLSQEKGISVLMKTLSLIKEIPFKIVGSGPKMQDVKAAVEKQQCTQVELTGFLPQDQCQKILRAAKVVVIPSLCYENFPRVVVEAFALGVPIIASRLGSLAELIKDSITGLLVEPNDPQALASAVQWAFENPLKLKQMGDNARREFEDRYTAEANYRQLINIYEDVIHVKKSNRH